MVHCVYGGITGYNFQINLYFFLCLSKYYRPAAARALRSELTLTEGRQEAAKTLGARRKARRQEAAKRGCRVERCLATLLRPVRVLRTRSHKAGFHLGLHCLPKYLCRSH